MRALIVVAVVAVVAGPTGVARAETAKAPIKNEVPGIRLVVAPLTPLVEGTTVGPLQLLVAGGLATLPGYDVVPEKELRKAIKKSGKRELESCDGAPACLAQLGRLVNASVVVSGEVGELGEGQVAYLKAIDIASEREIGATTAVFPAGDVERKAEARAAGYRLLLPKQYVGTLKLSIDVAAATVYLDGRKVAKSPAGPLVIPVGTHALRVTHDQYRDFVRFVDVTFDSATHLEVPLKAFPVITDDMRQKEAARRKPRYGGAVEPRPWYREWYTVAGVGVGAAVITAVIIALTVDAIDRDQDVTVGN